jgi:hypothetical protein
MRLRYPVLCFMLWMAVVRDARGQATVGKYRLPAIVVNGDTIPVVTLPGVQIIDFANPEVLKNLQAYYRLRFNVIKVYPYARLAALKIGELHMALDTIRDNRSRKKYIKEFERQLKEDFEEPLKKLSINQGKILVKLINRETGNTAYEVIREFRTSFSAFLWQKLAWLYGNDLKTRYDPSSGEDQSIEYIVQMIEAGLINQD